MADLHNEIQTLGAVLELWQKQGLHERKAVLRLAASYLRLVAEELNGTRPHRRQHRPFTAPPAGSGPAGQTPAAPSARLCLAETGAQKHRPAAKPLRSPTARGDDATACAPAAAGLTIRATAAQDRKPSGKAACFRHRGRVTNLQYVESPHVPQ